MSPYSGIELTQEQIEGFVALYVLAKKVNSDPAYKHLRLPFRRPRSAASREEQEDRLVDCVTALERLLASDSPNLEVTYRFRIRGAAMLPKRFGNEGQRKAKMNKLYALRSDVVHGNANLKEVSEQTPFAFDALRAIIVGYLSLAEAHGDSRQFNSALDEAMIKAGNTHVSVILDGLKG